MQSKHIIYAVAGLWLVLFVASFVMLQVIDPDNASFNARLNRIASFLTWQGSAFVVAIVLAWLTRGSVERGTPQVKIVGYVPLGTSVFVVGSFIAIMAYRVFLAPLLP
jgi:hypothetical protein